MADKRGFLNGYAGSGASRLGRFLVDRLLPGNQRAPDGTLQNVGTGAAVGAAGLFGTILGGPMVGMGIRRVGGMLIDRNGNQVGDPQAQAIGRPEGQVIVGDVQTMPGMNPQMGGGFRPSPYGPYAGAYRYPTTPGPWMTPSGFPTRQTSYGVNLPNYGPMPNQGRGMNFMGGSQGYNNGAGAGTGYGASSYTNDAWGETAAGFGVGATSAGTAGGYALGDAMRANRMNRV